jgi:hypothetical protein
MTGFQTAQGFGAGANPSTPNTDTQPPPDTNPTPAPIPSNTVAFASPAPVVPEGLSLFTSFEERAATPKDQNVLLMGEVGKGKTFQANMFPGDETLFVDMEAGDLSLKKSWKGTVISIRKIAQALKVHPWTPVSGNRLHRLRTEPGGKER